MACAGRFAASRFLVSSVEFDSSYMRLPSRLVHIVALRDWLACVERSKHLANMINLLNSLAVHACVERECCVHLHVMLVCLSPIPMYVLGQVCEIMPAMCRLTCTIAKHCVYLLLWSISVCVHGHIGAALGMLQTCR